MAKVHDQGQGNYCFRCLGCGHAHCVPTTGANAWGFNGNTESPTFTPSIKVTSPRADNDSCCHSYVENGRIRYLSDCTHHLANQTIDLPDWDGRIYEQ